MNARTHVLSISFFLLSCFSASADVPGNWALGNYAIGDLVIYEGSTYQATRQVTSNVGAPTVATDYWSSLDEIAGEKKAPADASSPAPQPPSKTVLYVDDNASASGDGSENHPYLSIQAALNASSSGDTVLVSPGTYVENIDFNGKNVTLGSLYLTTGYKSYVSSTIIDGNGSGSVVTIKNGEDSTAVLSGFTIINGSGQPLYDGDSSLFGGGWRYSDQARP